MSVVRVLSILACCATLLVGAVAGAESSTPIGTLPDSVARDAPTPKTYRCLKTDDPPDIDGELTDNAWRRAPWSDPFVDIQHPAKPTPRHATRMKMIWDDHHLYIAADLEEPHLQGSVTQRDTVIFQDNDFEVFIDPDGDNHHYMELEINALNTVWDLILDKPYRDNGAPDSDWNIAGLRSKVSIRGTVNDPTDTDDGWSVEIAIPFRTFPDAKRPPRPGQLWRTNFSRVQWPFVVQDNQYVKPENAKEDNWVWSPQSAVNMHMPERWGYVRFDDPPNPAPVMDPLASAKRQLFRLYYAQRRRHDRTKRWETQVTQLDTHPWPKGQAPVLHATDSGFTACVETPNQETLCVTHDSRLTLKSQLETGPPAAP